MTPGIISTGIDNFEELRSNNHFYVDKTTIIREMLTEQRACGDRLTVITRPRRFGKTLTLSMLKCFFDITMDSRSLFEGLAITKDAELCATWMNQRPVIHVTLKEVHGHNFESALSMFAMLMQRLGDKLVAILMPDRTRDDASTSLLWRLIVVTQKHQPRTDLRPNLTADSG